VASFEPFSTDKSVASLQTILHGRSPSHLFKPFFTGKAVAPSVYFFSAMQKRVVLLRRYSSPAAITGVAMKT
jgi:hypothetical protein